MRSDSRIDLTRGTNAEPGLSRSFCVSDRVVSTAAEKQLWGLRRRGRNGKPLHFGRSGARAAFLPWRFARLATASNRTFRSISIATFNERGAVSVPKVLRQIAARPHRIGGLIRLAQRERTSSGGAGAFSRYVRSARDARYICLEIAKLRRSRYEPYSRRHRIARDFAESRRPDARGRVSRQGPRGGASKSRFPRSAKAKCCFAWRRAASAGRTSRRSITASSHRRRFWATSLRERWCAWAAA